MEKKPAATIICFLIILSLAYATPADDLYQEGKKLYEQKRYPESERKLLRAIQLDPNHGMAHWYLGNLYDVRLGKQSQSLPFYQKARELLPGDPGPVVDTASAYGRMKDYQQSLLYYRKGIGLFDARKQKPWNWVLTETSTILRYHLNKPAEALSFLADVSEKYGMNDEPDILLEQSRAHINLKQFDKALYYNDKTLEAFAKRKERPYLWSLLDPASVYLFSKNPAEPDRALPYLEKCLSLDFSGEEKDTPLDWIAYAHYLKKNDAEFLRYANLYLDRGKNPQARKVQAGRLAEYYYKHGDLDKAYALAELQGKDSYLHRLLSIRKLDLNIEFHLQEIMRKHVKWVRPGLVYLSLPKDSHYQKLLSLKSSPPYARIDRNNGEQVVCFDFTRGFPNVLRLEMNIQYRMTWALPEKVRFHTGTGGKNDIYAHRKSDYMDIDNPVFVNRVKEIAGNGATPYEKIAAIKNWISTNVVYFTDLPEHRDALGKPEKWITFNRVSEILTAKKGHCGHYSDLFTAMCRALHIPARTIQGILINLDERHPGYHIVSEVYEAPTDRWLFIEPQHWVTLGNHSLQVIFTPDYQPGEKNAVFLDTIYLHHQESFMINNKTNITYKTYSEP
ncbi:MAG: hypothetical protein KBA61_18070 [Spirochaetes bacterium]|nr:hypothetical protein [Spirochaetota bacterium]